MANTPAWITPTKTSNNINGVGTIATTKAEITEIKKFIYALEKELTPVGDTPLSEGK